jgi:molybdenum cofactor cytidylyltransferase
MPVDRGNLLCFGHIGARKIIVLPGCGRSPKRNGLDLVLERILAGLIVDTRVIAGLGVGGLLGDIAERWEARSYNPSANRDEDEYQTR